MVVAEWLGRGGERIGAQRSGSSARSLGTPVHPPLTAVPIGAIVITAVLDVASAAGSDQTWAREVYRAGTFALMIGTAVLVVAIATGLADRSRTTTASSEARHKVNVHALLMAAVGLLAVADICCAGRATGTHGTRLQLSWWSQWSCWRSQWPAVPWAANSSTALASGSFLVRAWTPRRPSPALRPVKSPLLTSDGGVPLTVRAVVTVATVFARLAVSGPGLRPLAC